jgi:hypothetical protein
MLSQLETIASGQARYELRVVSCEMKGEASREMVAKAVANGEKSLIIQRHTEKRVLRRMINGCSSSSRAAAGRQRGEPDNSQPEIRESKGHERH